MKTKATYQSAFDALAPSITKPNETLNSPNPKGGISVDKTLIPDELAIGDVILLRVADVDTQKNEVHFEYLSKQGGNVPAGTNPTVPAVPANLNTL